MTIDRLPHAIRSPVERIARIAEQIREQLQGSLLLIFVCPDESFRTGWLDGQIVHPGLTYHGAYRELSGKPPGNSLFGQTSPLGQELMLALICAYSQLAMKGALLICRQPPSPEPLDWRGRIINGSRVIKIGSDYRQDLEALRQYGCRLRDLINPTLP